MQSIVFWMEGDHYSCDERKNTHTFSRIIQKTQGWRLQNLPIMKQHMGSFHANEW